MLEHPNGGNMRNITTLDDFSKTIKSMNHRERIVFPINDKLRKQYEDSCADTVEFYVTDLHNIKGCPKTLNVKITTIKGNLVKNDRNVVLLNKNKYIDLCTDKYIEDI